MSDVVVSETRTAEFTEEWIVVYWVPKGKDRVKGQKSLFTRTKNGGFGVRNYFRTKYPGIDIDSCKWVKQ